MYLLTFKVFSGIQERHLHQARTQAASIGANPPLFDDAVQEETVILATDWALDAALLRLPLHEAWFRAQSIRYREFFLQGLHQVPGVSRAALEAVRVCFIEHLEVLEGTDNA